MNDAVQVEFVRFYAAVWEAAYGLQPADEPVWTANFDRAHKAAEYATRHLAGLMTDLSSPADGVRETGPQEPESIPGSTPTKEN